MSRRSFLVVVSVIAAVLVAEVTAAETTAVLITVDQSGKGNFTKIQQAIDAVPENNREEVFIVVKAGIYREKVVVPANKPFITISGRRAADTIISWNDSKNTYNSATLAVLASDFVGRYLTIQVSNFYRKKNIKLKLNLSFIYWSLKLREKFDWLILFDWLGADRRMNTGRVHKQLPYEYLEIEYHLLHVDF